jgi:hypothetical protein
MLREVHNLPLRNAANQVQMQPPLSFLGFRIRRGTREGVSNQGQGSDASATNSQQQFPIGEQLFQCSTPYISSQNSE